MASRHSPHVWRILTYLLLACAIVWVGFTLARSGMGYEWQWNRVWRYLGGFGPNGFIPGPLLKGLGLTVGVTALGLLISIFLGLAAAVLRLSPWPFCVFLAKLYIALWRNTPLLLQLFFAYFLVSPLLGAGPFWTATLALAAFEGSYMAEVFRAGLLSVPKDQWEAALGLGLNLRQTLALVILPQAAANTWPSLTNQAIATLKDSSLVSAIAVADITMRSQAIVAETFLAFEVWILAGSLYLLLALALSLPGLCLENRIRWHEKKAAQVRRRSQGSPE